MPCAPTYPRRWSMKMPTWLCTPHTRCAGVPFIHLIKLAHQSALIIRRIIAGGCNNIWNLGNESPIFCDDVFTSIKINLMSCHISMQMRFIRWIERRTHLLRFGWIVQVKLFVIKPWAVLRTHLVLKKSIMRWSGAIFKQLLILARSTCTQPPHLSPRHHHHHRARKMSTLKRSSLEP